MGFLDHSSNNIILDAVLTDLGRQFLARNDGSFSVHKFALGDDEVNYGIISKYGRTVGKEKIEKNTPVFEALTNQGHSQKYRLISISNPNLLRLPSLSLSGDANVDGTTGIVTLGRNQQKTSAITIEQTIKNETSIDVELRDQTFIVEVPNLFCQILRNTPENVDGQQRATYIITRSPTENAFGGSSVQFTLSVKSLTDALFTVYGTTANKAKIKTYVKVTGVQSGAVKDITVIIDKNLLETNEKLRNMSTFKEILPSDVKTARSFLNQLVDVLQEDVSGSTSRRKYQVFVTGGVGPGVTSSLFQTVYDQDFTLQTANPVFDMTVGLKPAGTTVTTSQTGTDAASKELFPSSSLMMREKMDIYRQFAASMLGDSTQTFKAAYDSTTASDEIDVALFIAFKRLFARDQIKRETFAMRFYQSASFVSKSGTSVDCPPTAISANAGVTNLNITTLSGSSIYTDIGTSTNKLTAFGGQVGNVVDAANTSRTVGLMFYDRGVLVLDLAKITSGSQFMSGTIDAMSSVGTTLLGGVNTETALSSKFIPDFVVSASIDNIVDHIAACRFGSGSQSAITFQNITNINSTLIFCRAAADEFNYSSNPTFIDSDNRIVVIDAGQEDTQTAFTFVSSVGLYDSNDNLLAVAKLSRPVEKNPEKDLTLRVRLDFARKRSFRYTK